MTVGNKSFFRLIVLLFLSKGIHPKTVLFPGAMKVDRCQALMTTDYVGFLKSYIKTRNISINMSKRQVIEVTFFCMTDNGTCIRECSSNK